MNSDKSLAVLLEMGFPQDKAQEALDKTGDVSLAAEFLASMASPSASSKSLQQRQDNGGGRNGARRVSDSDDHDAVESRVHVREHDRGYDEEDERERRRRTEHERALAKAEEERRRQQEEEEERAAAAGKFVPWACYLIWKREKLKGMVTGEDMQGDDVVYKVMTKDEAGETEAWYPEKNVQPRRSRISSQTMPAALRRASSGSNEDGTVSPAKQVGGARGRGDQDRSAVSPRTGKRVSIDTSVSSGPAGGRDSARAVAAAIAGSSAASDPIANLSRAKTLPSAIKSGPSVDAAASNANASAADPMAEHKTQPKSAFEPSFKGRTIRNLEPIKFEKGEFCDVRDSVGKWLEGEIIEAQENEVLVHFARWKSKWDEWIPLTDAWRFSTLFSFSSGNDSHGFHIQQQVYVLVPKTAPGTWARGYIRKMSGRQVQVQYKHKNRTNQRWFHTELPEIAPVEADDMPSDADAKYWEGQFIEVLDTEQVWLPAEVLRVEKGGGGKVRRVFVHYEGWSARWDEWINLDTDSSRIRPLGVMIPQSEEERLKREKEEKFLKQLKDQGFNLVECEKDGNCLFRSVALQIYGDAELHMKVRKECYDYMEKNKDFFQNFVENFDEYVADQRRPHQWGDHVEIMAMRELYNKDVEIRDADAVRSPKPLGDSRKKHVKTIHLSYHGNNHYNALMAPNQHYPLGTGEKDDVRVRDERVQDEPRMLAESKTVANNQNDDMKASGSFNGRPHSQSFFRRVDTTSPKLSDADFTNAWSKLNPDCTKLSKANLELLISQLFDIMFEKKLQTRSKTVSEETLRKLYEEAKDVDQVVMVAERFANQVCKNGEATFENAKAAFFSDCMRKLEWALSR